MCECTISTIIFSKQHWVYHGIFDIAWRTCRTPNNLFPHVLVLLTNISISRNTVRMKGCVPVICVFLIPSSSVSIMTAQHFQMHILTQRTESNYNIQYLWNANENDLICKNVSRPMGYVSSYYHKPRLPNNKPSLVFKAKPYLSFHVTHTGGTVGLSGSFLSSQTDLSRSFR